MARFIADGNPVLTGGQLSRSGDCARKLYLLSHKTPGCRATALSGPAEEEKKAWPGAGHPVRRLFLLFLFLSVSVSIGCNKKAPAPTTIPAVAKQPTAIIPPAVTPSEDPASGPAEAPTPLSKAMEEPTRLELGLASFQAGDYGGAVQFFEDYVQACPNSARCDFALLHLFLSRRLLDNSGRSARKAEEALKRLVSEYPNSPYRDSAELILALQAQAESLRSDNKEKEAKIRQLSEELQKLKEIDMQRRPSKPLY
jgi:tetratricopeptide (TPR) repeat protein